MKNRRVISFLVAALSAFSTSLAVKDNVKIVSTGGHKNINKSSINNSGTLLKNNQNKKLGGKIKRHGKKKYRKGNVVLPSGAQRNSKGKSSVDVKDNRNLNSSSSSTLKSFAEDKPIVSSSGATETSLQKTTILPHVPNGLAYGVGGTILGAGALVGTELVLDKKFNRSMIDKLKYGITVQGLINYLKKNLKFVTKEVDGKNVLFLELDLENGQSCFMLALKSSYGSDPGSPACFFADSGNTEAIGDIKSFSSGNIKFDQIVDLPESDNYQIANRYIDYLRSVLSTELMPKLNGGFVKQWEVVKKAIRLYIAEQLLPSIDINNVGIMQVAWA